MGHLGRNRAIAGGVAAGGNSTGSTASPGILDRVRQYLNLNQNQQQEFENTFISRMFTNTTTGERRNNFE